MQLHEPRLRRVQVVNDGHDVRTLRRLDALRVLIVDDHVVFAEALASWLDTQDDVTVVGTAADAPAAINLAARWKPDLVLVDLRLGDDSGLPLIRALRDGGGGTRVLVVSASDDPVSAANAMCAGANGFLAKDADSKELLAAIDAMRRGETFLTAHLLTGVVEHLAHREPEPTLDPEWLDELSPRELDVLVGMTAGMSKAQIAATLYVSPNTVRTHVQHLFAKLEVHSGLEAVARAISAGLTPERAREQVLSRERRRSRSPVGTMQSGNGRDAINGAEEEAQDQRNGQAHWAAQEG